MYFAGFFASFGFDRACPNQIDSLNEFKIMNVRLPVLPTHLWVPTDYRTREEIEAAYQAIMKKYPPKAIQSQ